MISCILLSAGHSARFGSPKALAVIQGTPVIERLQQILIDSGADEIIVVLGAHHTQIKSHILNHKKVQVVYNKDFNLGQTSSFKVGLKAVSRDANGIMLLPVDMPAIKPKTINRLIHEFQKQRPSVLIPTYEKRRGHPPIFHAKLQAELLNLDNTVGLNSFEHQHASDMVFFSVEDPGILRSFNTPQEFEDLKTYLEGQAVNRQ